MPELPEVEALAIYLREVAVGQTVSRVQPASFSLLKTYDPPIEALVGRELTATSRRGKHLLLDHDGLFLVLHLARAGWLRWKFPLPTTPLKMGKGPMHLRVGYDNGAGFDVTEAGTEKRAAAWVVANPDEIENVVTLGIDPLDDDFTVDKLASLLDEARGIQLKGALTDQRLIAGVGNAYSDEALHTAKLSPFRKADKLTRDELEVLHDAIVTILRDAVKRSAGLPAKELKSEKKSGLRVHGRAGEPCPVCGDTLRDVFFASKSLQYCPTCQTGGKPLADRRLSRLLK